MATKLRAIHEIGTPYRKKQAHILDERGRQMLLAIYANPEYGSVEESIDYLVEKLQVPRTTILSWAKRMGLAHIKDDHWTSEELEYLQTHVERMSFAAIAEKLGRTKNAVSIKARRLKLRRFEGDSYSSRSLADVLGCHHSSVDRWIKQGMLQATWDEDQKRWDISIKAIRSFVIAYPREYDVRKADWLWLLDVLVGSEEIGKVRARRGNK